MTDDAPRPLTEEEVARIYEARKSGGLCGLCGRALAAGETVWMERLVVGTWWKYRSPTYSVAPVGAECASAAFRASTAGIEPEPCVTCGRGVHYRSRHHRRLRATCSGRCAGRYQDARRKEGATS